MEFFTLKFNFALWFQKLHVVSNENLTLSFAPRMSILCWKFDTEGFLSKTWSFHENFISKLILNCIAIYEFFSQKLHVFNENLMLRFIFKAQYFHIYWVFLLKGRCFLWKFDREFYLQEINFIMKMLWAFLSKIIFFLENSFQFYFYRLDF